MFWAWYKDKKSSVKLKIPAGSYDGMILKFTHGGSFEKNGTVAGDLYVELAVEPDERFDRRGDDIYSEAELSAVDAVLGTEIEVETVHGGVTLKIPAGTQPGAVFRIKGKGSPRIGNDSIIGDHYVKTEVLSSNEIIVEKRESFGKELEKRAKISYLVNLIQWIRKALYCMG
jgi:molecular chaperone DnaJ